MNDLSVVLADVDGGMTVEEAAESYLRSHIETAGGRWDDEPPCIPDDSK